MDGCGGLSMADERVKLLLLLMSLDGCHLCQHSLVMATNDEPPQEECVVD